MYYYPPPAQADIDEGTRLGMMARKRFGPPPSRWELRTFTAWGCFMEAALASVGGDRKKCSLSAWIAFTRAYEGKR